VRSKEYFYSCSPEYASGISPTRPRPRTIRFRDSANWIWPKRTQNGFAKS
jgi:hypothetical protein